MFRLPPPAATPGGYILCRQRICLFRKRSCVRLQLKLFYNGVPANRRLHTLSECVTIIKSYILICVTKGEAAMKHAKDYSMLYAALAGFLIFALPICLLAGFIIWSNNTPSTILKYLFSSLIVRFDNFGQV